MAENMADTSKANFSHVICTDCGKKGCLFLHWGRLVPDEVPHGFCETCMTKRIDYYNQHNEPMPLPTTVKVS